MNAVIGDDDAFQKLVESGPLENLLRRVSEPEDVSGVIVFLCRPESRQITGQVIHTSGASSSDVGLSPIGRVFEATLDDSFRVP